MSLKPFIVVLAGAILIGCSSTKQQPFDGELKNNIVEKTFTITSKWASPTNTVQVIANTNLFPAIGSSPNNINIAGNANFLKVYGDSISGELPYFGHVQIAGAGYLNNDKGGISFEGIPKKYKTEFDTKRNRYKIDFTIVERQEHYRVILFIYSNGTSTMSINSSHRSTIHYRGEVKEDTES
ncbi:MAG: DUF4251 domain-containing protein [Flavobacteriaceae bacterium]